MTTITRKRAAPHPQDPVEAAAEFPLDDGVLYLNHAAVGPLPRRTSEAIAGFCDEAMRRPTINYARWLRAEASLRQRLARLLGERDPEDVSLLPNTSHAVSLVAGGLAWEPGDSVVLPRGEFPSNRLPWLALERRGVRVREVTLSDGCDPRPLLEACDATTRLVAASWVRYDTGAQLDLEALSAGCRAQGVKLFLDAIQGLGAVAMPPVPVDYVAGGSHKWLLGPEGVGYLYATPEARAALEPLQYGWRMLEEPFAFDRRGRTVNRDGRRFEPGTVNMLGIVALEASIGLLEAVGIPSVEALIRERLAALRAGVLELGLKPVTPAVPSGHAGILALVVEDDPTAPERLLAALSARGVQAAVRGGCLRFSPHFHTPAEHVERVLDLLREALAEL